VFEVNKFLLLLLLLLLLIFGIVRMNSSLARINQIYQIQTALTWVSDHTADLKTRGRN